MLANSTEVGAVMISDCCVHACRPPQRVPVSATLDPVTRALSFAVRHELRCCACAHVTRLLEQYSHASLEVADGCSVIPSVRTLLAAWFKVGAWLAASRLLSLAAASVFLITSIPMWWCWCVYSLLFKKLLLFADLHGWLVH